MSDKDEEDSSEAKEMAEMHTKKKHLKTDVLSSGTAGSVATIRSLIFLVI